MPGPLRNNNASKNRPWSDAIRRALLADDGKQLRALAERMIEAAMEGDVAAMKEIGDRMEGKVPQQLNHAGHDGDSLVVTLASSDSSAV